MTMLAFSLLPTDVGDLPTFLALGCLSAMLVSVAKAGFGGSIGLLAVPIMIYACGGDTRKAVGVMLPLLIVCDQVAIVNWWGKWNLRAVGLMIPGAVLGVALGSAALWGFAQFGAGDHQDAANASMKLGIGMIALGFVTLQAVRSLRERPLAFRPVLWQGTLVGATAGFTSTLAHAAGPVVTMYLLPQQMPKGRYVASAVLYYWMGNPMKLPTYILLGLLSWGTMRASVLLMPAVVVGTLLGFFLHRRVGQKSFTGIVYVLLALAGGDLVFKAVRTLWWPA